MKTSDWSAGEGGVVDKQTALINKDIAPTPVLRLDPDALIAKGIEHGISVEGLERLLAMRERLRAEQARAAFVHALAEFQGGCPIITKDAVVRDKFGKQRYRYAPLDAIIKQVGPLLRAHDLTHRFDTRIEEGPQPALIAICIITHREGHSESSEFRVPIDRDAYMSEPQKFGAASSFAKRYAFCNALGILTGDQDTDAVKEECAPPYEGPMITPEQTTELRRLIADTGSSESRFCAYLKIPALAALPAHRFEAAQAALDRKKKKARLMDSMIEDFQKEMGA